MNAASTPSHRDETRGLWLGLLGVLIFALTFPMTRLAVGPQDAPQLPPFFVTAARAAGAGLLSAAWLMWQGASRPRREEWRPLAVSALGTVLGFPLFIALALREVPAMHAAVVTGVLPLATAALAAFWLRQRPSIAFWLCAVGGCLLVLAFAWQAGGGGLVLADLWLLLAVVSAALGYVSGAQLSARRPAEQVISWVLACSLPLTLPAALLAWPDAPAQASSWGALAYLTMFSMWLGFFAWYRALVLGGMVRVSQVQLVQPFLALLMAVPVLGEPLDAVTLSYALAVLALVLIGKRAPVRAVPAR
ncbi:DMT family transporter [Sphaerotilus mobilis]|uniref:Drug/metabolite transporter (DMT)-like permease n=1 Tax=Sphaerotilus mobilis TaxID=47994 RepID=A0A4Q7LFB2_9BURK|nr:DMT family transporter [Sphaerotilus mobilis]RZS53205.1 drug/metabolite transporter (DMT)-like permease [Sphaerotilus mobilis]